MTKNLPKAEDDSFPSSSSISSNTSSSASGSSASGSSSSSIPQGSSSQLRTERKKELEEIRRRIRTERFPLWLGLLQDMEKTASAGKTLVRFPAASSYLFTSGQVKWAMDPVYSVGELPPPEEELDAIAEKIADFAFIIITHCHADHCQKELISRIMKKGKRALSWILSEDVRGDFFRCVPDCASLSPDRLIFLKTGEEITVEGIRTICLPGLHSEPGKQETASGSFAVFPPEGLSLYFPVDVRDFHLPELPAKRFDFVFGHVWLGRTDNTCDAPFPALGEFCALLNQTHPDQVVLTHLHEISRAPEDIWTERHAKLAEDGLKLLNPAVNVLIPRRGDTLLLTSPHNMEDPFLQISRDSASDFLKNLGCSIKKDPLLQLRQAIAQKVPVLEFTSALLADSAIPSLLAEWREAGGEILSAHLPELPLSGEENSEEKQLRYREQVRLALDRGIDRVTVHAPFCSVSYLKQHLPEVLTTYRLLLEPLLESGIHIGIENMHMNALSAPDENRRCCLLPEECRAFIEALRKEFGGYGYPKLGLHLDFGHAYANFPFSEKYPPEIWLRLCGSCINGLHLHQFAVEATAEAPYPQGHHHVTNRTCGHPSPAPIFRAWAEGVFRAPIFLEVARGREGNPFPSLERLRHL